ncbi:MAG: hypothetical protein LRZ84_00160 [Desertifilum sp.]|nr:hypothetical protein [Desertifilum sp.]
MKKALWFIVAAIALTYFPSKATLAQNLNCPTLDEALVPLEHPVRTRLNQYYRAQGDSGEVSNIVRVGNYGAAYLWNADAGSATPLAIEFTGESFQQTAIASSSVAEVLTSWGASADVAQCTLQLLAESGI